ncbi:MAG: threonine dehydratase, partial [Betaproteobacteria bacterium]|nr:threonine dehydratase [Betaproteobacteria bacterium]
IKVDAVRTRGANVVLHGDSYDDAYERARAIEKAKGLVFVHPYDDPDVIAGQGTIGLEILRHHADPIHAIFVPIGGGGLIAGIGAYVKRLRPQIKLIGVEPEDADAMSRSLKGGRRVRLDHVGLFADGVAVKQVGVETFRLCSELVDEVILVDTDAMCAAIKDVFEDTRAILEPAGALAIAGAKAYVQRTGIRNQTLVAVASGANMNFDRLRFVSEEAELGEAREAVVAVSIPERPGSFRTFCTLIGARNITEFNYRYSDPTKAQVFVGVQVRDRRETDDLVRSLRQKGLEAIDFTDNELAKLHVRHLVGGHAPGVSNEILYRFEFPERPGALMKFLNAMSGGWNISLFHYRNHGADYGRVLVGMQVPAQDKKQFEAFLEELGYPYRDESANPAYQLFLG